MPTGDTETCPYCGFSECEADWVDVGVGEVQCGPFYCTECGASEIGPNDLVIDEHGDYHREWLAEQSITETRPSRVLTERERKSRWYEPETPAGSSANTVDGIPVDHKTAKRLYELGMLDAKGN